MSRLLTRVLDRTAQKRAGPPAPAPALVPEAAPAPTSVDDLQQFFWGLNCLDLPGVNVVRVRALRQLPPEKMVVTDSLCWSYRLEHVWMVQARHQQGWTVQVTYRFNDTYWNMNDARVLASRAWYVPDAAAFAAAIEVEVKVPPAVSSGWQLGDTSAEFNEVKSTTYRWS